MYKNEQLCHLAVSRYLSSFDTEVIHNIAPRAYPQAKIEKNTDLDVFYLVSIAILPTNVAWIGNSDLEIEVGQNRRRRSYRGNIGGG